MKARIQVRRGQYRGQDGWHILGKDSRGGSVRIFSTSEDEARRMAGEIRAGRTPRFEIELERAAMLPECYACGEVTRVRDRLKGECFCTPEQIAAKEAPLRALQEIADKLRETAAGLRQWQRTGCTAPGRCGMETPCVHPNHAANRLEKMADRISPSSNKEQS